MPSHPAPSADNGQATDLGVGAADVAQVGRTDAEMRAMAEWIVTDSPVPLEQTLARDVLALLDRVKAAENHSLEGRVSELTQALEAWLQFDSFPTRTAILDAWDDAMRLTLAALFPAIRQLGEA